MWRTAFITACTVLVGAMGALATETSGSTTTPYQLPDSIVVSANRFGLPVSQTIWPTRIIDLDREVGQASIGEQLDGVAGVDVRNYNGEGSVSTLSNWGVFNRHMLLLFNGRVVKDYSLGGFNLSEYSTAEVERIELLKGPQSAFFGSDAVGGVVNLITRPTLSDRIEANASYGSLSLQKYNVNFSRRHGIFGIGAFAEFTGSDNRRDNAGMEHKIASIRTDFLSNDGRHHAFLSARYFDDSLGVPGPVPDTAFLPVYGSNESSSLTANQKDENYSFDASYQYSGNSFGDTKLDLKFDLFWEKKNLDYRSLYNYQFNHVTVDTVGVVIDTNLNIDSVDVKSSTAWVKRSAGASARYLIESANTSLAGGIDYLSGSLRVNSNDSSSAVNTVGPFSPYSYSFVSSNFWARGQDQVDIWSAVNRKILDGLKVDMSGRVQFVYNRKSQPSFNLGALYDVNEYIILKVGTGYSYRLPTIAEQFAEGQYSSGNASLSSETAWTHQFTAQFSNKRNIELRLTVFRQNIDSLIQYRYDPTVFKSVPVNVEKFKSTGVDVDFNVNPIQDLYLNISAVAQKAEQTEDNGAKTIDAFYVPELKWRSNVSYTLNDVSLGVNVIYTSTRSIIMFGGDKKQLAGVYELGGSIGYNISKGIAISLVGYDLTDERQADQFGFTVFDGDYPTLGRRFIMQARISVL